MRFKPYYLFAVAAAILFIVGMFIPQSTMDIHLHDTYFVFSSRFFFWFLSILLLGYFLLYLATDTMLYSKKLTWIHVVITVVYIIIFILYSRSFSNNVGMPRRYYDYGNGFNAYFHFQQEARTLRLTTLTFILAQLLYVINLLAGIIKAVSIRHNK